MVKILGNFPDNITENYPGINKMDAGKIHSKIGIASCLIGLISFVIFASVMGFVFFGLGISDRVRYSEIIGDVRTWDYGFLFLVTIPVHFVGFLLGVISLFLPKRKKLFPILGIILNPFFGVFSLVPYLQLVSMSFGRV